MKRARQLVRAVNQNLLLAFESAEQGEMGIELRALIPGAQLGDHAGEPVIHCTRRDEPKMKHTHGRDSMLREINPQRNFLV